MESVPLLTYKDYSLTHKMYFPRVPLETGPVLQCEVGKHWRPKDGD